MLALPMAVVARFLVHSRLMATPVVLAVIVHPRARIASLQQHRSDPAQLPVHYYPAGITIVCCNSNNVINNSSSSNNNNSTYNSPTLTSTRNNIFVITQK
jgi:hypothetical protein